MESEKQKLIVQEIAANQTRLRAFVRCLLVRSADVDDLVQEINAVLWEKAESFELGTNFWAWACQIARYKALNQIRKYSRERLVFDDELHQRLASISERQMSDLDRRRDALQDCLQSLPAAQRQMLDLRYASGQTIDAIAKTISRPAGSIRQTLYRMRQALLKCIQGRLALEGDA